MYQFYFHVKRGDIYTVKQCPRLSRSEEHSDPKIWKVAKSSAECPQGLTVYLDTCVAAVYFSLNSLEIFDVCQHYIDSEIGS